MIYEVKTTDGVVHRIDALTHVLDSNGLTLYVTAGSAAAIFPKFEWMRQSAQVAEAPVTTLPSTAEATDSSEVSAPVASGE